MRYTSAVTVKHGTYHTLISNITMNTVGGSAHTAEALTCWQNRRWMMNKEICTLGVTTHAQSNTTTQFPERQDPLDWLVCHCSHDLIVSDPYLTHRYGDQSDTSGKRTGRTVMDWCSLRLEISHRQDHGGQLNCKVQQQSQIATGLHGKWKEIWYRCSSGVLNPRTTWKLFSTK